MEEKSYLGIDSEPLIPPSGDEKTLALLSHVLTLMAPVLAPLIIWLVKKDESTFVATHAKESLNFQISLALICIGLAITVIGTLFIFLVIIVAFVWVIVATIKANDGKLYKYPINFRLIK